MNFTTEEGQQAYKELLDDLSERVICMYAEIKNNPDLSDQDRFMMNLAVEAFQQEGLSRAIVTSVNVDTQIMSLRGHLAAVAIKEKIMEKKSNEFDTVGKWSKAIDGCEKPCETESEEDSLSNKAVNLERLNLLLDATASALAESSLCGFNKQMKGRARRLQRELVCMMDELGVSVPDVHTVRIREEDGSDGQYEVEFPIYVKRDEDGDFRRIDENMEEVTLNISNSATGGITFAFTRKQINFLDGNGPDYWLGRGIFACTKEEFESKLLLVVDEILKVADK
jgi:hypothetical protein